MAHALLSNASSLVCYLDFYRRPPSMPAKGSGDHVRRQCLRRTRHAPLLVKAPLAKRPWSMRRGAPVKLLDSAPKIDAAYHLL